MASTYSPNLRLELIGTGDQQGTWGATTNTNLGTLLEEAIGGYVSISVTDGADTVLSTANGAADQSRNMTIELTGLLSASRNVICPAIEKVYIVKNSTTSNTTPFAVTFKVSGQTGVSIPNGATYIVYVDGTDVRQATGSVASGGTGTSTSTGTGSVVLSASPTLTGTPLIGSNKIDSFASGTRLPFQQTTAPTGWTKDTTQNDKTIRIVSGSVGTGGTTAFSSVFTSRTPAGTVGSTTDTGSIGLTTSTGSIGSTTDTGTVGGTALTLAQIPSHSHGITYGSKGDTTATGAQDRVSSIGTGTSSTTTNAAGSGSTHTHSLTMNAHSHSLTMNSHNHTLSMNAHNHSFTGTAMDFSVQYVDFIIAQKD